MFKHYYKIAYRNLLKHKGYAIINIIGLAVGMACCFLIMMYVQDELSFDKYHEKSDRIYRVLHGYQHSNDGETLPPPTPEEYQVWGNAPIGRALNEEFPEIQKLTQFTHPYSFLFEYGNKRFQEENILFMDSTVFDIFSWKFIHGIPDKALSSPFTIVLTESVAKKYFGDEDPVGQFIKLENSETYMVTGVMEDVPANSHFTFNALISMSTFRQLRPDIFEMWGYVDFYTYFIVNENTDIASLKVKVPEFIERHVPDMAYTIDFEPITAAHMHSVAARQPGTTSNPSNVYIFSIVAAFILLIACINFMNLSTARSMERAKEVGVRKVAGAQQSSLVQQFLGESLLLSILAAAFALGLVILSLPALQEVSGKDFTHISVFSLRNLLIFLGTSIVVGLFAGSYPAWVLSSFRPALAIKDVTKSSIKGAILRKGLVIFQFSLSIALIAGTAIVFSQLEHLRSKDLGFRQEQMLIIDFGGDDLLLSKLETIKSELLKHPDVQGASASRSVPGDFIPNAGTGIQNSDGAMMEHAPLIYEIDFDFIENFDIEMVAGRSFSRKYQSDTSQALIVNEAATKLYGYHNPEDIIGKRYSQWGREGTVIGVVKDFNFKSLHSKVEPLSIRYEPFSSSRISLRIHSENLSKTIGELERIWVQVAPNRPFLYNFLDDSFNQQYQADYQFGQIFSSFAALAIFIACLGLLGLATFTAKQRTKEFGVRKVLGASVTNLVALLSKDFLKLVLISIAIATPFTWYVMKQWLSDFACQVEIGIETFVVAGIIAISIAMATISWQALRSALMNPVKSLRNE